MTLLEPSDRLWLARIDESVRLLARDTLSPEELARSRRIRQLPARRRFVAGRLLIRRCLSLESGIEPGAWRFCILDGGRPEIAEPNSGTNLRFNLTHCDGLVACIVSRGWECGVDAENLERDVDAITIVGERFGTGEREAFMKLPESERRSHFFSLWTLKEAYGKALGSGIGLRLDMATFSFAEPGRIGYSLVREPDADRQKWHFALFSPSPSHVLSVALRRETAASPRIEVGEIELDSGTARSRSLEPLRVSS